MSPEEVFDLLSYMAARDRRTVGKTDVTAWHEDVGDLAFDDCREAVRRHFRASDKWMMPVHVRDLVKEIRAERLANSDLAIPAVDPGNEEDYRRALRDIRRQVGDGRMPFRAIEGGKAGGKANEAFKAARSAEDNKRVLGQTVDCPVPWCNALAGEPCLSQVHGAPMATGHPSRIKAARKEAS